MLRRLLLMVAMVVTVGATFIPSGAMAFDYASNCAWPTAINGRNDCYGYFTGQIYPGDGTWDYVISSGMEVTTSSPAASEADFVKRMQNALYGGGPARDVVGAAFLVDVMMGKDGPVYGCPSINGAYPAATATACRNNGVGRAVDGARSMFTQWKKMVHYYNSKGWIDWDYPWAPTPCTAAQPYYENSAMSLGSIFDVTYHSKWDCSRVIEQIHFFDPTTNNEMMIQRICGNMLGSANKLTMPTYALEPDVIPTNGMAWGDTVSPYDGTANTDYYLTAKAHNPGTLPYPGAITGFPSDRFQLQVDNLSPAYAVRQLDSPTSPGAYDTGPDGYATSCAITVPNADCWYWEYGNGLPWNRTSIQTNAMHFRVAPGTPEGTQLCFAAIIDDANFADSPAQVGPAGHCFVVHHPRFVAVQGHNSDVHAGGGLCDGAGPSTGAVTGNDKAIGANGAYGDYVVSASAAAGISGIGSNGAQGSTTLNLGKAGAYGKTAVTCVRRPDLVKAAGEYVKGTGFVTRISPYTLTAGDMGAGVIYVDGNVIIPAITITDKLTIYATGTVTITGDITVSTTKKARADLPSLGIIAKGNVLINPAADNVDAYIFSNGDINTCAPPGNCNNTLTMHGFLMSNSMQLRRMGPSGLINSQIGENIILSSQIYLNPPKLFDASVDDILLEGQGEKQPLF